MLSWCGNILSTPPAARANHIEVGRGQCGTVLALNDTDSVVKIPNSPAKEDELFTDYQIHYSVYSTLAPLSSVNISVPRPEAWITRGSTIWFSTASCFPKGIPSIPNYGLISKRILSVRLCFREDIVDLLCPKAIKTIKTKFLARHENNDCLVRLYLGRRSCTSHREAGCFQLRNFPLHVNEMKRLGLRPERYAVTMAQTLAFLHWKVGIDANDVEFVLGGGHLVSSSYPSEQEVRAATKDTAGRLHMTNLRNEQTSMWLLDFNQCQRFEYHADDEAGCKEVMKKLVEGFWFNDPYYPRPTATDEGDKKLWGVFVEHYLKTNAEHVSHQGPREFIEAVVEKGKQRSESSLFSS
ncbi:hypothetical protein COCCADRAFT_86196 [Bipolaris zeicola 26-R-13]|uniref:DUF3669 domain-containing protein n=1 Tax=Cochliobolus carbonum (strain 26-R-13) TaxID=930089 RepID=W6YHW5_COCC2|nr:uncharacterized protein COCCADRAFT_86196 [Bipolaris zeicola 26-R-13]EUC37263.1 hypothetical protein COCCADRAFT_86196 [Bipolaris zeicola 26-R-13]